MRRYESLVLSLNVRLRMCLAGDLFCCLSFFDKNPCTFESFTDQQASKLLTAGFRCELALAHAAAAGSLVPLLCLLNAHVQLEYSLGTGLFPSVKSGLNFLFDLQGPNRCALLSLGKFGT